MSNVSITRYMGWPTYDTFLIVSLMDWPVYDPNPLKPNPNPRKPMSGLCRVRGLGRTLIPLNLLRSFKKLIMLIIFIHYNLRLLHFFNHQKKKNPRGVIKKLFHLQTHNNHHTLKFFWLENVVISNYNEWKLG